MASPCSSSSSSRHDHPLRKPPGTSNTKAFYSVNDYINSYLTENLLKPQLPHLNKSSPSYSQSNSDGELPSSDRSENRHRTKIRNKTEAKRLNELTKEMDKMVSRLKSKRQTNDILQLFKNTLNNFIIPEHPMDGDNNAHVKSELKKENQVIFPVASGEHHYHVQASQEVNEIHPCEQNLFSNRETSVTVRSTLTRCKIKEPKSNIVESSKTNVLHRCYGKQSVKASPQVHRNRKKSNSTNTNCQRPQLVKSKIQKSPKQQARMINQQMKTIYENEQFHNSEKLILENVGEMNELVICDSSSHSSVETDKTSAIETHISSNEVCNDEREKSVQNCIKLQTTYGDERPAESESITKSIEPQEMSDRIKNQSIIMELNGEHDNSIVQRLTSFWNKKLNSVEQNKSMSNPSFVTSSLTSIFEEEYENMNQKYITGHDDCKASNSRTNKADKDDLNDSIVSNESELVRDDLRNVHNDNKKLIENSFIVCKTRIDGGEQPSQNVEIPQLKAGLMDELLTVLRSRDNVVMKHRKKFNEDKIEQNINYDRNDTHSELNISTVHFHHSVEMYDTGDEKSEYNDEYHVDSKSNANSDDHYNDDDTLSIGVEQCDEQTFEVIEKCLLENLAKKEINKNKSCVENQFDIVLEEPTPSIIKIDKLSNDYDDGLAKNEIKNYDESNFTNQIENNNEKTNCNLSDHSTVITNLNSIIKNLKELIHIIESIPEELKSVDMNLNCLPIPDKIKRKISSLIVTSNTEPKQSELSISKSLDGMDTQLKLLTTPAEKNQLFRCSSSGKLLGYSKKEGYICTLYFPKILTKPILERVKNPIQKVYFPKRSDYLKSNLSKFNNMNVSGSSNKHCNKVEKGYQNRLGNDKAIRCNNDDLVIIEENCDLFGENLLQNNGIADKEGQIVEGCITATSKIKARSPQSSIFYVTPPPNSIVTQLLPPNKPKDEYYAKLMRALLNKPVQTTAVVSIQNKTSNVKFEENFLIENKSVNSVEELSDGISVISYTLSNSIQPEDFNAFTINDIDNNVKNGCFPDESDTVREEIRINLDENRHALPNDLAVPNRRNTRKRRYRLHNNLDDDNILLNGGSGDSMHNCGDGIVSTTMPSHQTSSMSVIVSNSINDCNSQPDINIVESEYNLSRSKINSHCNAIAKSLPPQDVDNFSICSVIQEEESDEQLSEIDDFFMMKQHTSKTEINKTVCGTVSTASTLSQNTNLSNNLLQCEKDIQIEMVTCHKNNNSHSKNELSCNTPFMFQNLSNKITEETSLIEQNLSNNAERGLDFLEDESVDELDKTSVNENCCKNKDSYRNYCLESVKITEQNSEESDKIVTSQQEIEVPVTSFLSESINTSNINITNLSHVNLNINYINKNSGIEEESSEFVCKNTEGVKNKNISKKDFHRSYHTLYFETDISNEGKKAITNKIIISNYKNNLDMMLENDPVLKDELLKIIDVHNLCDKEKQMIAACIYMINQKFSDRRSTFVNTSKHNNLSLASGMNTLWDKTSQTMFITINLAKKSLMPYDFETETLLYRRRCKKLFKRFYTLLVSLLLVFLIQKHFFGILLPVCFPW